MTTVPTKEKVRRFGADRANQSTYVDLARKGIRFTDLSELPDRCHMYPVKAQQAFLVTYNNLMVATDGDVSKAMVGANRAMRNYAEQLKHREKLAFDKERRLDRSRESEAIAEHTLRRLTGGQKIVVVF